ncbi:baculoviral IAP repeat-containing protein 7 isoform X1 [Synchiropus splendidus]|uniref:baculoviral IAP repeat-containing protein 7 isoform X1 n=1 Tax=Synchiropus splendidus TaxID=270530 RepID=UPI00237DE5CC|nr:baculoviral IAP repeat-containing protein 7 isoform X1 [Synchiropus splendidus]
MTLTGPKEKGIPSSQRVMGDRSPLLYILEEPGMRREEERLRTYHGWPPDAPVTSGDLAKAGFFFLGPVDTVQCFCCGGVLRCWVHGDRPAVEHKRHFPVCGFILGQDVGNVPLQAVSSDLVDGQLLTHLQRLTIDDQGSGVQAVYPELEDEDSRLTTFHNWPTEASVQPDILARAGFFYTGHADNVKCFYCDGGLRNWEPGDDPWQEHAKWFPRCEFLIQERGQDYISNIQDTHFHVGETVVESESPSGRDVGSRNVSDVVGSLGASSTMLSPVVQTVLQMGFEVGLLESLVQTKYLLTGQHYTSVSDLVSDVLQAEEEDGGRTPQGREVRQGSSTAGVKTQISTKEKVKDHSPEELLRQLQEERTCKVCMDKLVSIVFIPCGHLVVCGDCAASLRHCPICRAVIRGSVRAFMS